MGRRTGSWKEAHYPESRFGGFTDVDGTVSFYFRVQALLRPQSEVLDVGCGRGAWVEDPVGARKDLRWMKGKCARVIGIDVSETGRENPSLDEFRLLESERWPLADASVDLVLADHVLEHVASPETFFSECRRVLRATGHLCLRTSNRWSYVALASRLVPNHRHAAVLARAQDGRHPQDVFPTLYRCNTARGLRRMLAASGFDAVVRPREAEPSYLAFSRLAYALGVLHQRLAPGAVRPALFVFARKSPDPP
ncbi:MAG TPA: class I SAM-dependent methyltransferase, partial [Candidatus Polarisedimenticolaceae bacterium]|nr:class I SAM-dependent methyltransferase [Candidatus Polarisedimenticolaceae bacterium]